MAAEADALSRLTLLVEQSRAAAGRETLAGAGMPRELTEALPHAVTECLRARSSFAVEQLSSTLKALRNLCAGVEQAQNQLADATGCERLASLLHALARAPDVPSRGTLLVLALQALGNACVQHPRNQASAWSAAFPDAFVEAARVPEAEAWLVHPPLCMVLLTCCRQDPDRLRSLCSEPGISLLRCLLAVDQPDAPDTVSEAVAGSEFLALLIGEVCGCGRRFMQLYCTLGDSDAHEAATTALTPEQSRLLSAVADAVELSQGVASAANHPAAAVLAADAVALQMVLDVVERSARGCSDTAAEPVWCPGLAAGLHLLRALAAERPQQLDADAECATLRTARLLVELLASLCPPEGPRARSEPSPLYPASQQSAPLAVPASAQQFPARPAYVGYRRDLVAALSSLCHGQPAVVREIVRVGGVLTIVQQCRGDSEDTFVREWALWAVRNMCEVSADAQELIRELDAQSAPTLDAAD